jgi:hypothetical protein
MHLLFVFPHSLHQLELKKASMNVPNKSKNQVSKGNVLEGTEFLAGN